MSGSLNLTKPWSGDPNAPNISPSLYFGEKVNFVGDFIAAILYGVVIALFFQCMRSLLDPINHTRGGVRWGLVIYTLATFSFATIATGMGLNLQSISRIDGRDFPGFGDFPPGPYGYKYLIYSNAISVIPNLMFLLNQWLADGLLLYRCYIIYFMNCWVVALPCLMYIASLVIGIVFTYQGSRPGSGNETHATCGLPYFMISLSLNILLTLMIVVRLILHSRSIQSAMGTTAGAGRLYKLIVITLIESSALYVVSFLLFIASQLAHSWLENTFWPILNETQAIAPLLIILRVANRSALESDTISSGNISTIRFRGRGKSTGDRGTLLDEDTVVSVGAVGAPDDPGVRVEAIVEAGVL